MNKIIVAIDGYSSSGKSTMARDLAKRIGYIYVDSGAMYRAVTLYALRHSMAAPGKGVTDKEGLIKALPDIHISFSTPDKDGVQHTLLNGEDVESQIRGMEVSELVSPVAEIPEVRSRLVALQKEFGEKKGIVMDGRDIGTTVFPHAEMKVFVEASPEKRAERRFKELEAKGRKVSYKEVFENICQRDHIDTTREVSPLRKASDAHLLDNGEMDIPQQMQWLLDLFQKITGTKVENGD